MAGGEVEPPGRYRVEFRPRAVRELRKIDPQVRRRIQGAIELLAVEPHPPASRRLRGSPYFRVRVGDYRVIYSVDDNLLLVLVLRSGHRRQVYDR